MCAAINVGEGITAAAALCSRLAVERNDDVIAFLGDERRSERDLHRDVAGVVAERGVLFRLHDREALINLGYRGVVAAVGRGSRGGEVFRRYGLQRRQSVGLGFVARRLIGV